SPLRSPCSPVLGIIILHNRIESRQMWKLVVRAAARQQQHSSCCKVLRKDGGIGASRARYGARLDAMEISTTTAPDRTTTAATTTGRFANNKSSGNKKATRAAREEMQRLRDEKMV